MKLSFTDTEAVHLLSILQERKRKYTKLSELAQGRMKKDRYNKNAEKLMSRHKCKSDDAQNLVNKIAGQL